MSMHAKVTKPFPLLITLFLSLCFIFGFEIENNVAFSFDFFQRDSFGSPLYNASLSKSEIIRRAIARNVNKFSTVNPNSRYANIFSHKLDYLMKIRLGTPPVDIIGVADTGSSLTWTQCKPFTRSIPQRMPLFDMQVSSSYAKIPCGSSTNCPLSSYSRCEDGSCHYIITYSDHNTYSKGLLSKEMMRMESTHGKIIEIPNYIFGCGTNNNGYLADGASSGIIGLGAGPGSFVSQLGSFSKQRFSYCLIRLDLQGKVGHIRFGRDASIRGSSTITVPLVIKTSQSFYFTTIHAFTIGRVRINCVDPFGRVYEDNLFVDSGSAVIEVPRHLYPKIKDAVIKQTNAPPVLDPHGLLDLCFIATISLRLPNIVANVEGGDIALRQYNAYAPFGEVTCLAFRPNDQRYSVYGSFAQQNFIVGYDFNARTITFKPSDCTKF